MTTDAARLAAIKGFLDDCGALGEQVDPVPKLIRTCRELLAENARLSSEVAALRAETIEECAKVARTVPVPGYYNQAHERTWMSARIAAYDAIRALVTSSTKEQSK